VRGKGVRGKGGKGRACNSGKGEKEINSTDENTFRSLRLGGQKGKQEKVSFRGGRGGMGG